MKSLSIHELKAGLATAVSRAAAGERILITRHGRPVASLVPADLEHLHAGPRFGKAAIRPLLRRASRGKYIKTLEEDRSADRGRR